MIAQLVVNAKMAPHCVYNDELNVKFNIDYLSKKVYKIGLLVIFIKICF